MLGGTMTSPDRYAPLHELGLEPLLIYPPHTGGLSYEVYGSAGPRYMVPADDLLALIEQAPRVWMHESNGSQRTWHVMEKQYQYCTHTALLFGIKPLVVDTAEGLLRELILWRDTPNDNVDGPNKLANRAEKLLAKGE